MDLLHYSDSSTTFCFRDKPRREVHDILRAIFVNRERIRICPCVKDPWLRETLRFLGAQMNNEPSH
jgi:hypothetical protein